MMTLPMWLVLAGGALTLAGGFIATYQANQEQLRSSQAKAEFEAELRKKNEEIAKLSVYGLNMLSGGDSFPFTDPAFNIASPEKMDLWLINGGTYPLYDVTVTIRDMNKFQTLAEKKKASGYKEPISIADFETKIQVGNLRPAEINHGFYSLPIPSDGDIYLRVEIASRNSYVEQNLHIVSANVRGERKIVEDKTKINGKDLDRKDLYSKITKKD